MTVPAVLERAHFQQLLDALQRGGYRVVGPTVRDAAIVYEEISSESELPAGWTDERGGSGRLSHRPLFVFCTCVAGRPEHYHFHDAEWGMLPDEDPLARERLILNGRCSRAARRWPRGHRVLPALPGGDRTDKMPGLDPGGPSFDVAR